jgi:hypothetical protein
VVHAAQRGRRLWRRSRWQRSRRRWRRWPVAAVARLLPPRRLVPSRWTPRKARRRPSGGSSGCGCSSANDKGLHRIRTNGWHHERVEPGTEGDLQGTPDDSGWRILGREFLGHNEGVLILSTERFGRCRVSRSPSPVRIGSTFHTRLLRSAMHVENARLCRIDRRGRVLLYPLPGVVYCP